MGELAGTILITGGMGFIGSNFIRHLLAVNTDVRVVNLDKLTYAGKPSNLADLAENKRCVFVRGDICDEKLVAETLEAHGVRLTVLFAAESHVDRSIRQHVKDRPGHDRRYALDWTKMRRQLNWTPATPFTEGIRQTVEWYRMHSEWWQEILLG